MGSWRCPFPSEFYELGYAGTNQQLALCGDDEVVLFWEKARSSPAENRFCFAQLKWHEEGGVVSEPLWGNVSGYTRKGSSGMDCYPEFVCSSFKGRHGAKSSQVVVLNTVQFTAEQYELGSSEEHPIITTLPEPPATKKLCIH